MTRPDDDTLMAYVDNALDQAGRARINALLATDPELRRHLEALQAQNALVRRAFEEPMSTPAPKALVDLILAAPQAEQPRATPDSSVVAFRPRTSIWSQPRQILPLAASLLLAVGIGVIAGRGSASMAEEQIALGPQSATSVMARVLETSPIGVAHEQHVVVATFRDRSGRVCREVERLGRGGSGFPVAAAVACRGDEGVWTLEGAARVAAATVGGGYTPSGAPQRDALDGVLSMLGAGPALDAAAETALRNKNWRP